MTGAYVECTELMEGRSKLYESTGTPATVLSCRSTSPMEPPSRVASASSLP